MEKTLGDDECEYESEGVRCKCICSGSGSGMIWYDMIWYLFVTENKY